MSTAILTARFRILTPMFIGDALQRPRLRAPAIKGVMRFWHRAVNPGYMTDEPLYFGGQRDKIGQSPWLLTVEKGNFGAEYEWRRGNQVGLNYLGYPFALRGGERKAIRPEKTFTLRCLLPHARNNEPLRQRLAASLWCLGNLGALGTRSRRGFGALALQSWTAEQGEWPELDALPLLAECLNAPAAVNALQRSLAQFRNWFGEFDKNDTAERPHPHLGPAFRFKLQDAPRDPSQWDVLLDAMGAEMQEFRSKQKKADARLAANALEGKPPERAPDRAAFGLPLSFRFRGKRDKPGTVTFLPVDPQRREKLERHGSLLLLRPALIGNRLYPLYLRMDGDIPGYDPRAGTREARRSLARPNHNAMDEFFNQLRGDSHG